MVDVLTNDQRKYNMSQIKNKNTQPEIKFRKYLLSKGIRGYRIHLKILGKPDIVFSKYKIAVFIDGCFWHKCPKCFIEPETNKDFWMEKINGNVKRDKETNDILTKRGWKVIRFWEHEINNNINKCFLDSYKELKKRGKENENS